MSFGSILEVARLAGRPLQSSGAPPGEVLIQCPSSMNHRNDDAHPSCRLNPEKNTWYCDPCGRGGGVVDLAKELAVSLPKLTKASPRKTPTTVDGPRSSRRKLSLVFVPRGSISLEAQRRFAEQLGKNYAAETWAAFGVVEGTIHPDGLEDRAEPAIAFSSPDGGIHAYRYERKDRGKRWCFANGGKPGLLTVGLEHDDPVILCEGEWDAMRAYEMGFAVATGTGGAGTWKQNWNQRLAGRHVVPTFDVDEAGIAGATNASKSLSGVARRVTTVSLPLTGNPEHDGKDLSDFFALHSVDEFRALLNQAEKPSAGFAGLAVDEAPVSELIDIILSREGPIRLKRREAAKLVIDDLRARGELVQASAGRLFWYDRQNKRLYDLDAFPFRCLFLKHFQINPAEREYAHIFEAVKAVAREDGRRVHVVRFAFYDKGSGCLYVHGGRGSILRLDGSTITAVDNGTDDVLFEDTEETQVIPPESLTLANPGDPVGELIVRRVNFARGSGVILSPDQQSLIFRTWILAIFFPELLPARCLLLLYGEKGSGKTTTLRVVLKLLLGPQANVTPLGKEDGFNAAVSSEYLLVFDNVDSYCKWIEDRLATVATGQTIRLRKLYTTNEMLSFPTRCAIALTARTPRFRRDDVVDRLQILRVARLETFAKESNWYQEVETHRARLWAQMLRELNAVVASLRVASADSPDSIRMADWASLATTIGDTLDQGPAIRSALEASELDKAHFLLEADEVYDLLHALAHDRPDTEWRAGELFAELKRRAEHADVEFTIKSPRSLGRILHRLEPALMLMISFQIATDAHDKQAVYTLGPLRESDGVAGGPPLGPLDNLDV